MSEIYKYIFEQISGQLTLPVEPTVSLIITWIINRLVFQNAWDTVGSWYRVGFISGKESGSALHWIIRTGAFIVEWVVVYAVIVAGRFVINHWLIITCTLFVLTAILVAAALVIRIYKHRRYVGRYLKK